jgi:ubiquinone/menaquinone biosynthesis C-methylase UbiE
MSATPTVTERLLSLWDHLGIDAAHIGLQMAVDVSDLAERHPHRIAGLLFCEAPGIHPEPFAALASRMIIVAGDRGAVGAVADRAHARLPGSRRVPLAGYDMPFWADCITDHAPTIVQAAATLTGVATPLNGAARTGNHAGITYRISGSGPALVLMPLFLAPSQWEAVISELSRRFTVIVVGGRHIGGVAILENRARYPTYAGMLYAMLDRIAPAPGQSILEVGSGTGALLRLSARRLDPACRLQGVDLNPFLLREAAVLAAEDGLADRIVFGEGNAERLPFADASFDHVYSITVLEECDADKALRELRRVVKPGGRVGVAVRAIDMQQVWNATLPESIQRKIETPPQLVSPGGVADRSLYRRMAEAGFEILDCFPVIATFTGLADTFGRFFEERMLSRLDPDEAAVWRRAAAAARADGSLFATMTHHCVVGVKRPHQAA